MREIVHLQAGQCGNQIGAKFWEVRLSYCTWQSAFFDEYHFFGLDGLGCFFDEKYLDMILE